MLEARDVKEFFTLLESWDSEQNIDDPILVELNRAQRLDLPRLLNLKGSIVLDAGCGDGRITYELGVKGASQVVGADISSQVLAQASQRLSNAETGAHFTQCDLDHLPFRASTFNAVTMMDTLVHLPDLDLVISEITTSLSLDGMLIVNTTNRNPFWRITVQKSLTKFLKDLFLYHFPSYVVRPILKLVDRKMIGRHLTEAQFRRCMDSRLELVEFLQYGDSPPVYFMISARKVEE
jgi:ubiquinone/menaquinone biosynthesis C-methylase UbiE